MKYFFTALIGMLSTLAFAQFTEDFTDGDFTINPIWVGDDTVFTIFNNAGDNELRSNKLIASTQYYLSTASTTASDAQWEFYTRLNFNTSSANYVDVYLTCDQSDLLNANLNGYLVRIGGTADEICLYKNENGTLTKIIDGTDGATNVSASSIKVKVKRTSADDWTLEYDLTGVGTSYVLAGMVNDATFSSSAFFGVSITMSTASFFQDHYFDDFYVGPIIVDTNPPVLISATPINSTQIDVLFSEALDQTSAELTTNYTLNPAVVITTATLDGTNPALVHLDLASTMTNGQNYTLTTANVADLALNASGSQQQNFTYLVAETPTPGDVVINEFVCDPSPVVGLPEVEFVEVYNRSTKTFDLTNWKLGDASADGTIGTVWLGPGEYLILCASASLSDYPSGVAVSSFPSLNNTSDDIVLKDNTGLIIDKISYTLDWYNNSAKDDGGYSIERINPELTCSGSSNWSASNAAQGGTPGAQNSVYDNTPDTQAPNFAQLIAVAPNTLEIYFTESMDSTTLADGGITLNPLLNISTRTITSAYPEMMTLTFDENIVQSQFYSITYSNVADCAGNPTTLSGQFALPDSAITGDVVLNELLFDPYSGGSDWIELYNNSDKLIDLQGWQVAHYEDDTISDHVTVVDHYLLFPDEYVVLGADPDFTVASYPAAIPGKFISMTLPSMNNDSSTVYLINKNVVLDQVAYEDDWHFKLLDSKDGKSLERLDPSGLSQDQGNWHTAAEAIGFGTPGGKNSQYYPALHGGVLSLTSQVISPDNDGFEDVLQINYEMEQAGLIGSMDLYDALGRKVRSLLRSELLGVEGTTVWDGLLDDGTKASIGKYILIFEAYDINGELKIARKVACIVAGKL